MNGESLLSWFRGNARDLPWRTPAPRDPYAVWISEAMLQQTTVAAVIPHYLRWMNRFPCVATLANAEEAEVLAYWQGLGYYRRARNLHAAARIVAACGEFPANRQGWQALPGIGPYTAAAIASIAFDEPVATVDGNVERVFARIHADDSTGSERKRRATGWAESVLDRAAPSAWNEALMELGATICTPRSPKCSVCPVREDCRAFRSGQVSRYPEAGVARQWRHLEHQTWVVRCGLHVGLTQAAAGEWWAGLYHPPRQTDDDQGSSQLRKLTGIESAREVGTIRHVVTDHKIHLRVFAANTDTAVKSLTWFRIADLQWVAISAPGRRAIALALSAYPVLAGSE